MFCPHCGAQIANDSKACEACGAEISQQPGQPDQTPAKVAPRTSPMAIWSLVLGILGWFTCIPAIPGLILGIVGLKQINAKPQELTGKGLATAGIVLSAIGMFIFAAFFILTPIILPVMSLTGEKARMNKCMTQLHEIGLAVQMFKQDYRQYPDILGSEVMKDSSGNIIPFDQLAPSANRKVAGLFPKYVKSARCFSCPDSKIISRTAFETYDPIGSGNVDIYSYDSYDFVRLEGSAIQQHYSKSWANDPADVESIGMGTPSDPQQDYERQLKWKTPPDDTVITWCSWHESPGPGGKSPVLFLDGHVDVLDAADVENYKWRVQPKKE